MELNFITLINQWNRLHNSYFKATTYSIRNIEDILFLKPDVDIGHIRTGLSGLEDGIK